jgi:hypothetical protein
MRHKLGLRVVAVAAVALAGCAALLDVKDIHLDASDGGAPHDGSIAADGPVSPDGASDAGGDATACVADFATDPKNCGRCGHDCVGGACAAGKCAAFELGTVAKAPLAYVVASGPFLFASTITRYTTELGGIWRIPKAGGLPEPYVTLDYAEAMGIVGDTLYFIADDTAYDGVDLAKTGGFYSCPVAGPAPCAPTLIAAAESPGSLTVDKSAVYYTDKAATKGIMRYAAPGPPSVFREGFTVGKLFVDDPGVFYTWDFIQSPEVRLLDVAPDGGFATQSTYANPNGSTGQIIGNASSVIYTAYDYRVTTGGVVRRYARVPSALPCDFGGTDNKRPYGLYADATRVYWTNQGGAADHPYTGGSLATCDASGCCTTPDVLWTGDGEPTAITGDATALYFVLRASGSIMKLAKP